MNVRLHSLPAGAVLATLTLAVGAMPPGTQPAAAAERPNFVLVVTDDQSPMPWPKEGFRSARPFGYCGADDVYTPHIDRLAADGVVFTRAYASSSVCSPSRYAMLTGRYAGRCTGPAFGSLHPPGTMTRVENNTELEGDRPNVARLLAAAGYDTGFVGKSHLVDHHVANQRAAWSEHGLLGYEKTADPRDPDVSRRMRLNQQRWRARLSDYGFTWVGAVYAANLRELYNDALNVHNVDWTTEAAVEFLSQERDRPFFLYYATTVPHGPDPWNRKDGRYWRGVDGDPGMTGEGFREDLVGPSGRHRAVAKRVVADHGKAADEAWLTWFDASIGRVCERLESLGQLDNTVFIVTSDHGAWRHGKTTLYEGGVRIPLLVHWPAGAVAGTTYDGLVQNIDITPTLLDLAEVNPGVAGEPMDGVSLAGALRGDSAPVHDDLFFELGYARAVTDGRWKYIAVRYDEATRSRVARGESFEGFKDQRVNRPFLTRNTHLGHHAARHNPHYFEPDQLYDLVEDPREEHNLARRRPDVVRRMRQRLQRHLETFPDRPFGELTSGDRDTGVTAAEHTGRDARTALRSPVSPTAPTQGTRP